MIILDSDHLTILFDPRSVKHVALRDRMEQVENEQFATTIISVEEQSRGWLALICAERDLRKQVYRYGRFLSYLDFLRGWLVIPFDDAAAQQCTELVRQRIRIGAQDLKIPSIALVNDALLLSANLRDFRKVPGLKVDSWIE